MTNPLRALFWYRLAHSLWKCRVPFLPKLIQYGVRIVYACQIPAEVELGEGTVLGYEGLGIVFHPRVRTGKNCVISQGVTLGGTSRKLDVPILGDNVYLGAGAKVLGPVTIGDDVVIGANAVVVSDIPSGSLAVGVPAKIIKSGIKMSDYV